MVVRIGATATSESGGIGAYDCIPSHVIEVQHLPMHACMMRAYCGADPESVCVCVRGDPLAILHTLRLLHAGQAGLKSIQRGGSGSGRCILLVVHAGKWRSHYGGKFLRRHGPWQALVRHRGEMEEAGDTASNE